MAMGLRFRRSARLGPLGFHCTRGGLRSLSVGGPGPSCHRPLNRAGGPRSTPGLPNCRRLWPSQLQTYVLRAQGQAEAKRRAQRCITALQEAASLAAAQGWLVTGAVRSESSS